MGSLVRPTISTAVTQSKNQCTLGDYNSIRDLKIKCFFSSDGRLCTLNGDAFLVKAPRQT